MSQRDPFGPLEHELKFAVDRFRLEAVAAQLEVLCRRDRRHPANTVLSLYYDTPDLRLLREKVDSHYLKTKVRLRWYQAAPGEAEPQRAPAFLEVKRRVGCQRRKARLETGLDGRRLALLATGAAQLLAVPELLRWAGIHPGGPLEPFLLVRYLRRRFVEPLSGARVCLDTAIQGVALRLPAPRLAALAAATAPALGPGSLDGGVLEVKGAAAALPAPLTHLVQAGCLKSSFSKYGLCYQQLAGAAA